MICEKKIEKPKKKAEKSQRGRPVWGSCLGCRVCCVWFWGWGSRVRESDLRCFACRRLSIWRGEDEVLQVSKRKRKKKKGKRKRKKKKRLTIWRGAARGSADVCPPPPPDWPPTSALTHKHTHTYTH